MTRGLKRGLLALQRSVLMFGLQNKFICAYVHPTASCSVTSPTACCRTRSRLHARRRMLISAQLQLVLRTGWLPSSLQGSDVVHGGMGFLVDRACAS